MLQTCPTREQWCEIFRRLANSDVEASYLRHLDHCQKCWALISELDEVSVPRSSQRGLSGDVAGAAAAAASVQLGMSAAFAFDYFPSGTQLGPFRLLSPLGTGGMGCVYLAIDDRCGRQVAVKCLNPAHRSAEFSAGLAREARLLSQLRHPNVVQLLEFNMDHDPPYLVLELAAGGSLRTDLKHRTLSQKQSVLLTAAVARAVHAAHESGVLHLDLKPENILLTEIPEGVSRLYEAAGRSGEHLPWTPKVADFGLCASLHGHGRFSEPFRRPQGTLAWMAPEQFVGQAAQLGRATDVYALGIILYELLTGVTPFRASHELELCAKICCCPPCPPHELCPGVCRKLSRICLRCLRKEPADRFSTSAELADELESLITGPVRRGWFRRPFRFLQWPKRTAVAVYQPLLALAGLAVGAVFLRGCVWPQRFSPAPTQAAPMVTAAALQDAVRPDAELLAREIEDGDRALEYVRLQAGTDVPPEEIRRVTKFLLTFLIGRSREILGNSSIARAVYESDPQALLLARLYKLAGLAEAGEFEAAAVSWEATEELARGLHARKLLDERLRWRGFIAARLIDDALTCNNRGVEGLQVLRDAWLIFGPATHGQPLQKSAFKVIFDDYHRFLQKRSEQQSEGSKGHQRALTE